MTRPHLPTLIRGGQSTDDRGTVAFVNAFTFDRVKRFYLASNHREGFVRAWHAHRKEEKYFIVVSGAALVAAVLVDDWEHPSRDLPVSRFVLSQTVPDVLFIPAGYANGWMSLTTDTRLLVLSTASLSESQQDDVRYDAHYWDPWAVQER